MSDGHYGGSKGRRWKVDWEKTPQPVQIKIRSLRGVKDKLPGTRDIFPHINQISWVPFYSFCREGNLQNGRGKSNFTPTKMGGGGAEKVLVMPKGEALNVLR